MRAYLLLGLLILAGCDSVTVSREAPPPNLPETGKPVAGLTGEEQAAFTAGLLAFSDTFSADSGKGPLFNSNGCAACHDDPFAGGYGDSVEIHVSGAFHYPGCDILTATGGPVMQQHTTPDLMALGYQHEPTPAGAVAVGLRTTPLVFGMGLLDAVPDEEIRALAVTYVDGVHGHAAELPNGVGRFGRKGNERSLDAFTAGAYINEMGMTNSLNPQENSLAGLPIEGRGRLDLDDDRLFATMAFMRFLDVPAPLVETPETLRGYDLFVQVGCAECHMPILTTGPNASPALNQRAFAPYTDLLLHDLGPEDADICNGVAGPSEWRTQPLMGAQFLDMFMHDGASPTVSLAVNRHGGEASAARVRFQGLPLADQKAIEAFVTTR